MLFAKIRKAKNILIHNTVRGNKTGAVIGWFCLIRVFRVASPSLARALLTACLMRAFITVASAHFMSIATLANVKGDTVPVQRVDIEIMRGYNTHDTSLLKLKMCQQSLPGATNARQAIKFSSLYHKAASEASLGGAL